MLQLPHEFISEFMAMLHIMTQKMLSFPLFVFHYLLSSLFYYPSLSSVISFLAKKEIRKFHILLSILKKHNI